MTRGQSPLGFDSPDAEGESDRYADHLVQKGEGNDGLKQNGMDLHGGLLRPREYQQSLASRQRAFRRGFARFLRNSKK